VLAGAGDYRAAAGLDRGAGAARRSDPPIPGVALNDRRGTAV